jgi:exopolyphosphatase/guanosine-5'-triphosphate,3'-diphosphate pyrophosphatase
MRRADNAQLFIDRIVSLTASNVTILSGQEEASCSFRGAVYGLDARSERVGVLDVGGGSTEYATGRSGEIENTASCEIGAVRLTEWFANLGGDVGFVDNDTIDGARERARQLLAPLHEFPSVTTVIAVGGTATTSASVVRGHRLPVDRPLRRDDLAAAFNTLCKLSIQKRRYVPGMVPQRADILPAGMMLLDTALEVLGHERCRVSSNDLLLGYLLSHNDAQA